jgi:hypothetical protein
MKRSEFNKKMHHLYLARYPKLQKLQIRKIMSYDYSQTEDFEHFKVPNRTPQEIQRIIGKENASSAKNDTRASSTGDSRETRHQAFTANPSGMAATGQPAGMNGSFSGGQGCFMMPQGYPFPFMMPQWQNGQTGQPPMPYIVMNPMMANYPGMAAMYSGNAPGAQQMPAQQPYASTLSAVEVDSTETSVKQVLQITQHEDAMYVY